MKSSRKPRGWEACALALIATAFIAACDSPLRLAAPGLSANCPPASSTAVEPGNSAIVAGNPARRGNLITAWDQAFWSIPGAHAAVGAFSLDDGLHWQTTPLPFLSCQANAGQDRADPDPVVSVGPDGTAYMLGLSTDPDAPFTRSIVSVVSTDDGRTWQTRRVVGTASLGPVGAALSADPARSGTAYGVWQGGSAGITGPARTRVLFAKTTDGGRTWSTPTPITGTGRWDQPEGNQLLVDPRTGRLYDIYCDCSGHAAVAYVVSDDHGRTWSPQRVISYRQPAGSRGAPAPGISGTPPVAAISASGQVVVAWDDDRFHGASHDDIAVSTSRDGGQRWSAPQQANTPADSSAALPSIAVTGGGRIGMTYFDLRRQDGAGALFTADYRATVSGDGVHFTTGRHLAGPFTLLASPAGSALPALGFFRGLAATGHQFISVFEGINGLTGYCLSGSATQVYTAGFADSPPAAA